MNHLPELPSIRDKIAQRRASSFASHSHFSPDLGQRQQGRTLFLEELKKGTKRMKLHHNFSLLKDVFSPTKYCQMNLSTFDSLKNELKRSIQCKFYDQQIIAKPQSTKALVTRAKINYKNMDIQLLGSASKVSKRTIQRKVSNPQSNLKRQKKYLQHLQSICRKPSFYSPRQLCDNNKFWNNSIISKRATINCKAKHNKSEDHFDVNGW